MYGIASLRVGSPVYGIVLVCLPLYIMNHDSGFMTGMAHVFAKLY